MLKMLNLFKYGLTALMMAFAMTLCYSCSSDDDEQNNNQEVNPPSNGESGTINGHDYVVLAGYKWATENVGEVNGVLAKAKPNDKNNGWGCYYYTHLNAIKAAASWGGTWKLPTVEQWEALMDENYCTWTWKTDYSFNGKTMNGYIVSDKDDASKFIFLPAAGFYYDWYYAVIDQGIYGYYWSSVIGRFLDFGDGNRRMSYFDSINGMAVRPVSD